MPRKKRLFVVCAIDADIFPQVESGNPKSSRAKWDGSVVDSLRRHYTRVELLPVNGGDLTGLAKLAGSGAQLIFNLALSATPLEPAFAACVEFAGLACTGSSMGAIALANDKIRSRMLLAAAGVRVPRFVVLAPGAAPDQIDLTPPLFVKPALQGSSWGISSDSKVMTREAVLDRARRIWERFGEPAVADEFVQGREFRVGLIEGAGKRFQFAGIGAWTFREAARGFRIEGNHKTQRMKIVRPSELPATLRNDLIAIAQTSFEILGIRGYASLDVRVDDLGRVTVLEVNANPGISSDSPLWSSRGFDRIVRLIVEAALRV
ncbi:MAG: D-alanine-D-alanine ligase [Thermoanaerobaculia bacterium]|jgi:D-alanine-D-alanine ligase|nr:D-alanine-D-alanine ligase [Thermoanaerobaculia bacterium]